MNGNRQYPDGGPSQPFGTQHPDDGLPSTTHATDLSGELGANPEESISEYIGGRRHGGGHPVGASDVDMRQMVTHGVRQARRQVGKQAKSGKPPKLPGMDSSAKKTGY